MLTDFFLKKEMPMEVVTHFFNLHDGIPDDLSNFVRIDRKTKWGNNTALARSSAVLTPEVRWRAVQTYEKQLENDAYLISRLGEFEKKGILCHCDISRQACHGEAILRVARRVGAFDYPLILDRSLLAVPYGIITHQVNCRHSMGAGIAAIIKSKWPVVYQKFMQHDMKPGQIQFVKVREEPLLYVCNLAGQEEYGRCKRQTDYNAVDECLKKLSAESRKMNLPVYFPRKIGCDLAGGDWPTYAGLIAHHLPDASICAPMSLNPELYSTPVEQRCTLR